MRLNDSLVVIALAALVLCLLLSGCASAPVEVIKTVEVKVPQPIACSVDPGPRPPQPDTAASIQGAANLAVRVDLMLAGILVREGWIAHLEAANRGCQ